MEESGEGEGERRREGSGEHREEKCLERGSQRCAAVGRGWLEESPAFSLACPPLNPAASRGVPSLLIPTSTPFHGLCPPKRSLLKSPLKLTDITRPTLWGYFPSSAPKGCGTLQLQTPVFDPEKNTGVGCGLGAPRGAAEKASNFLRDFPVCLPPPLSRVQGCAAGPRGGDSGKGRAGRRRRVPRLPKLEPASTVLPGRTATAGGLSERVLLTLHPGSPESSRARSR